MPFKSFSIDRRFVKTQTGSRRHRTSSIGHTRRHTRVSQHMFIYADTASRRHRSSSIGHTRRHTRVSQRIFIYTDTASRRHRSSSIGRRCVHTHAISALSVIIFFRVVLIRVIRAARCAHGGVVSGPCVYSPTKSGCYRVPKMHRMPSFADFFPQKSHWL